MKRISSNLPHDNQPNLFGIKNSNEAFIPSNSHISKAPNGGFGIVPQMVSDSLEINGINMKIMLRIIIFCIQYKSRFRFKATTISMC